MKKKQRKHRIALAVALLLFLAGCSGRNAAELRQGSDGVDLDLTRLSSTMVYSEVYNMRYTPEDYYGKVVRIRGLFSAYPHPETGEYYYNCVIPDATACCSQGLQFFPSDDLTYPEDFPENGVTVTVVGTFREDEANVYMCSIADAVMEVDDTANVP